MAPTSGPPTRWVKVLDQTSCIGCHACTTACKSENEVPVGVTRTYVKSVDVGVFPQVAPGVPGDPLQPVRRTRRAWRRARPQAMYRREDGIVDFDKRICIGCKACMAACPYDAIFINPEDHSAEKCNICAHRLDIGLEPACVTVCPTEAILVGDLNDPDVAGRPDRRAASRCRCAGRRRKPGPGVFYKGAHQATLDPLAARRPDGGLFAWATQGAPDPQLVTSGHPGRPNSVGRGAAVLRRAAPRAVGLAGQPVHLDQGHRGRRLRSCPSLLALAGLPRLGRARCAAGRRRSLALALPRGHRRAADRGPQAPAAVLPDLHPASLAELAGARLVHHRRLRRPWSRCTCSAALAGSAGARQVARRARRCRWPLAAAVYTAYLFAQAKARDLWQSPLLAAAPGRPGGAGRARRRCCRSLAWLAPGRAVTAAEVIAGRRRRRPPAAGRRARSRCRTSPRTPTWPPAR